MVSEPDNEPTNGEIAEEVATAPDPIDLPTIAADIADLPAAAAALRGSELLALEHTVGRLAELAAWWSSAAGDRRSVEHDIRHQALLDAAISDDLRGPEANSAVDAGWAWGLSTSDDLIDSGTDLLVVCVTADSAEHLVAAELMGLDATDVLGWPVEIDASRGIDDEAWMDDLCQLRDALYRTRGAQTDAAGLLRAIGDARFAAAVAAIAQATARRTPVLIDGLGAAVAAMLVQHYALAANQWWQVAQVAPGRLGERVTESLRRNPLLQLDLRIQDGTGARLAMPILSTAMLTARHATSRTHDSS